MNGEEGYSLWRISALFSVNALVCVKLKITPLGIFIHFVFMRLLW